MHRKTITLTEQQDDWIKTQIESGQSVFKLSITPFSIWFQIKKCLLFVCCIRTWMLLKGFWTSGTTLPPASLILYIA